MCRIGREAAQTEIGLTGGGNDNNLLYLSGIPHQKVVNEEIINQVVQLVEEKAKEKIAKYDSKRKSYIHSVQI